MEYGSIYSEYISNWFCAFYWLLSLISKVMAQMNRSGFKNYTLLLTILVLINGYKYSCLSIDCQELYLWDQGLLSKYHCHMIWVPMSASFLCWRRKNSFIVRCRKEPSYYFNLSIVDQNINSCFETPAVFMPAYSKVCSWGWPEGAFDAIVHKIKNSYKIKIW